MTQITAKTIPTEKARIASAESELATLKSNIEKALTFHKNTRTVLDLPLAKLEAFGTVIGYDLNNFGGDVLHYIDFKKDMNLEGRIEKAEGTTRDQLKKYRRKLGFLVIDAMGHNYASSIEAAIILNSVLPAMQGELSYYGKITPDLFRHVATSLARNEDDYRPSTLLYGEATHIPEENVASLKLIRKGHPAPLVWRIESKSLDHALDDKWKGSGEFPVGINVGPSATSRYHIDKTRLNPGDIVIPFSDGLMEYAGIKSKIEENLGKFYGESVADITTSLVHDIIGRDQIDDVTIGVIKYAGKN